MGLARINGAFDFEVKPTRQEIRRKRMRADAMRRMLFGTETKTVWRGQRVCGGGPRMATDLAYCGL